jgi:hypothetical protein
MSAWLDKDRWRLRFAFEAEYFVVPPVPVVGLAFDLAPPFPAEFIYPLKRILRKAVRFEGATALQ